jgi:phosphatidylglycerol---prolipoprotein diacylglyceryl transferase
MLPEIHIGPLDLQTFGICFALGFVAAFAVVGRRLKELGRPPDWAYEAGFAALVGGLVGSRVDFLIQNWDEVKGDSLTDIFSGSGLVWFGGLLGGAIAVCLWAWRRGFLNLQLLDMAGPALAIGQAVGRVGCQLSGDGDYGIASNLPWAMSYPDGTVPTTQEVHPTPVYESLTLGIIAVVLWRLRDRVRPGTLFALYLVLAGLGRFLVEFIRRNDEVLGGLTLPQLISLAMITAGTAWIVRERGVLMPARA